MLFSLASVVRLHVVGIWRTNSRYLCAVAGRREGSRRRNDGPVGLCRKHRRAGHPELQRQNRRGLIMTKRSGNLGGFIMTLLLLLIGSALIYGNIFNREIGELMANLLVTPLVGAGLGLILIFSVVLRWVGGFKRPKDAFINFHSDDGSVGISTKAICDFI